MAGNLDQMIAEVEAALHDLYLGRTVVRMRIDGEESEYNRTSIPQLEGYLARLRAQKRGRPQYGAVGFVF